MLVVNNLSHKYGQFQVLKNISFQVEDNTCVGVMGESGSGKSSLVRFLIGLEKADSGSIAWQGVIYKEMNRQQLKQRHREMQIVFQDAFSAVNPNFTVRAVLYEPLNVFYGSTMSKNEKQKLALEVLEQVELKGMNLDKKARHLSGGQLQRLCLARALIVKPQLLILDEALSGLDPLIQNEILELLARLKNRYHFSYVFIAHDFASCYYLCDKIIILDNGQIIETIADLDQELDLKHPQSQKLINLS